VAVGFQGRSGNFVDQIQLLCGALRVTAPEASLDFGRVRAGNHRHGNAGSFSGSGSDSISGITPAVFLMVNVSDNRIYRVKGQLASRIVSRKCSASILAIDEPDGVLLDRRWRKRLAHRLYAVRSRE